MALDIGIGDGHSFCPVQAEPLLSLDNDGYYWFLNPLFEELAAATGQYIDLYGDASFFGRNLAALEKTLKDAYRLVDSQPDDWQVCIGWELVPHQRETRTRSHKKEKLASVKKSRFLFVLSQWERVIARAKELEKPVVCFGD